MNILIISTIDTGGGGARIPWNIMAGLKEKGHKVSMFVGYKNSNDPDVHKIPLNPLYYRLSKFFATDLRFARSSCIFNTKEYKGASGTIILTQEGTAKKEITFKQVRNGSFVEIINT